MPFAIYIPCSSVTTGPPVSLNRNRPESVTNQSTPITKPDRLKPHQVRDLLKFLGFGEYVSSKYFQMRYLKKLDNWIMDPTVFDKKCSLRQVMKLYIIGSAFGISMNDPAGIMVGEGGDLYFNTKKVKIESTPTCCFQYFSQFYQTFSDEDRSLMRQTLLEIQKRFDGLKQLQHRYTYCPSFNRIGTRVSSMLEALDEPRVTSLFELMLSFSMNSRLFAAFTIAKYAKNFRLRHGTDLPVILQMIFMRENNLKALMDGHNGEKISRAELKNLCEDPWYSFETIAMKIFKKVRKSLDD